MKDMTGKRFSRLSVLERGSKQNPGKPVYWLCQCDCGTMCEISGYRLRIGKTTSCGCRQRDLMSLRFTAHGVTKGNKFPKVYHAWRSMRARCLRPRGAYMNRGIRFCDRWETFENFYADMGDPPSESHSLDRINNDGNYEPENCRWATKKEQASNRRGNLRLIFNGEVKNALEWSVAVGISLKTISQRIHSGWTVRKSLTTRPREVSHGNLA